MGESKSSSLVDLFATIWVDGFLEGSVRESDLVAMASEALMRGRGGAMEEVAVEEERKEEQICRLNPVVTKKREKKNRSAA